MFLISVPVGVLGVAAGGYLLIDESRDTSEEQRPDVPGCSPRPSACCVDLRPDRGEHLRLDLQARRIVGAFVLAAVR